VSYDTEYEVVFIITVYEPSIELWTEDFKIRRKKIMNCPLCTGLMVRGNTHILIEKVETLMNLLKILKS
jgi:hypothetical protein